MKKVKNVNDTSFYMKTCHRPFVVFLFVTERGHGNASFHRRNYKARPLVGSG